MRLSFVLFNSAIQYLSRRHLYCLRFVSKDDGETEARMGWSRG